MLRESKCIVRLSKHFAIDPQINVGHFTSPAANLMFDGANKNASRVEI